MMKKTIIATVIGSVFMLAACSDNTELTQAKEKLATLEQQSAQQVEKLTAELNQVKAELATHASQVPALHVKVSTVFEKEEEIKHTVKDEYDIETTTVHYRVQVPETGIDWLDTLLVQVYSNTDGKLSDKVLTKEALTQQAQQEFSTIVDDIKKEPISGYEHISNAEFEGQRENIVTFSHSYYSYAGGAHGVGGINYINIDTNKKAIITLNDLIAPAQQDKLKDILWGKYKGDQAEEDLFVNRKDFDFIKNNNFYFSPAGLHFVYPVYTLGPYVEGEVELTVSWYEINALLNKDYQRESIEMDSVEGS
ncbi:DUF3298 and DUF4163 domain-containing protein [Pelistega sp. NLN82]|uniref:DUF3298 and DUF4163 domain-containing protein n=1 Tax=Pelistega ratti TaxID=2652177 RepID=A0A6L9Y4S1_9BURK|nr:DUF3298 and DUF4163 domain-containing protein [Pelistega ratti]NEN74977.1 DUF3298 and DUF4163 domain-containing protein [Pelistega ratti]